MLVVIGDLVADLIVLGGSMLERGTDNPAEVRLTRGGSAANVAVAAVSRHPVRFIGCVGDDTLGRTLVRDLEDAGVDARVQRTGRTGAIVVLVDAVGERTMITDRGAAAELGPIDASWLTDAEWVHLPLYGFTSPRSRQALLEVTRGLAERGVPVSLDLSSTATMRALGGEVLNGIIAEVAPSVVFANADEAALAVELRCEPAGSVVYVVKRGGDPAVVRFGGESLEVPVDRVPDVLDSTGAGDAFAAGYLTAAVAGATAYDSARAGSVLAMSALRRAGAL
ncbi:carbohydrate kinase family protein [Microbacterium pumilum]|uniref:PfkB family carbohydrate kinase n=1 Tax=Microbacterium pumilum TaxID=344165 RepID=A0ABP5DYQ4_9MICO